jgi:hypothetical protein
MRRGRSRGRYDQGVRDLVFVALVLGFFALAAAAVAGCDRIVGRVPVGGGKR